MAQGAAAGGSGHLPKRRPEGAPPAQLPRQRKGTTPQQHGRYPDYDVLRQAKHWDRATREAVLARVHDVPRIRFFSASEERALRAFCDVVMAQDEEPKVPVLEMVDAKLFEGRLDGFRHHDMPPDPQTWRMVAAKLDEEARKDGWEGFAPAGYEAQGRLVETFAKGHFDWPDLPCKKAFSVVMRGVLSGFYSHPWAWNEIGFGGPAYPRGFARLGAGQREPWESPPQFELDPVKDVQERGLE
jgi:Gluconate 2-dehydrogenase subunit 3